MSQGAAASTARAPCPLCGARTTAEAKSLCPARQGAVGSSPCLGQIHDVEGYLIQPAGPGTPIAPHEAETPIAERVAAEAYQVIGVLAHSSGLFEHPEVIRALDYFSGETFDGSILPFGHGLAA